MTSCESLFQNIEADTINQDILNYVLKYGNSASLSILNPGREIFSLESVPGIIGYKVGSSCAIVFGEPLCKPEDRLILIQGFEKFCKEKGWHIIYFCCSDAFTIWYKTHFKGSNMQVGEEFFLIPTKGLKTGNKSRALRNKINLSLRFGIRVAEYKNYNPQLENKIEKLAQRWVNRRKGAQIYLSQVDLFAQRVGKRWFYALYENRVVGVLLLHEVQARQGWLIQFLMTEKDAPIGTSEQLIATCMQALAKEECPFLSFGAAQAPQLGEIQGLSKTSKRLARVIFKLAAKLFQLEKRRRFWRKFQPEAEHFHLVFSSSRIRFRDVISFFRALHVDI